MQDLIATGAAVDEAMPDFYAGSPRSFRMVEIRVADICTDVRDTVMIAGLARALVETADRCSAHPRTADCLRLLWVAEASERVDTG